MTAINNKILYNKLVLRWFKETNNYSLKNRDLIKNLILFKSNNFLSNMSKILYLNNKTYNNEHIIRKMTNMFFYMNFDIQKHILFFIKNEKIRKSFMDYTYESLNEIHLCDLFFNIIDRHNDIRFIIDEKWNKYLMKLLCEKYD